VVFGLSTGTLFCALRAERSGPFPRACTPFFGMPSFLTLLGTWPRGGRSVGAVHVANPRQSVLTLKMADTPMQARCAPPDRLVIIGGILGTLPSSFTRVEQEGVPPG
jgi:hypothetical protein